MKRPAMLASALMAASLTLAAQTPQAPLGPPPERDPLNPAPARRARRGARALHRSWSFAARRSSTALGRRRAARSTSSSRTIGSRDPQRRDARLAARAEPSAARRRHEIDATGMYVMPGLVDLHVHAGGAPKNPDAEYPYKLWLAHGITTVAACRSTEHRSRSRRKSAARRTRSSRRASSSSNGRAPVGTRADRHAGSKHARGCSGRAEWRRRPEARRRASGDHGRAARRGEKVRARHDGASPADRRRADERARAAKLGLGTVTHFYGLFEAMYEEQLVQPWPVDMNYNDEQIASVRSRGCGTSSTARQREWNACLKRSEAGTTLDPTMTAYAAGRD